jgi:hypothetical protein
LTELFINGVDVGDDATLASVETSTGNQTHLRYTLVPGASSSHLWAQLYRSSRVIASEPIRVALGWDNTPSSTRPLFNNSTISLTDQASLILAIAMVASILVSFAVLCVRSDMFRDAPAQVDDKHNCVRAAYSLGRLQTGIWFLFAATSGLFLWVIYGHLPPVDGSVLAILGISVGVTGMSLAVDKRANDWDLRVRSNGLLVDLVTGHDNKQQVHRYQSVVANVILLFVGVGHVVQHLTYPVFDASWLAFLGISGIGLAAGKQIAEVETSLHRSPSEG